MRISSICTPGLLVFCTILLKSTLGYHIFITDPSLSVVWDASLQLRGCRYDMYHGGCKDFLLDIILNSESGLLSAQRSQITLYQSVKTCSIKISITNCEGLAKVVYPLHITVNPHQSLVTNFQVPMNVSIQRSVLLEGDFTDAHNSLMEIIIPETLRSQQCEVTTKLPLVTDQKIPDATTYSKQSMHNTMGSKVTILQSINCIASHNQEAVVPNQEIVLNVDSHHIHDHMKSNQHPTRRLLRHRRGTGRISFNSRRQTVEISENLPSGSEVIQLVLNNPHHVPVEFILQATSDKRSGDAFHIDATTGLITTKRRLDRENMASHTFRVTARGGGSSDSCMLFINVKDMNDNKPKFERSSYAFTVQEDEELNAYIGRVRASDLDQGQNQRVIYSIEGLSPPNVFSVGEDGEISLRRGLDRESKAEYRFNVVATDSGTLPQHASAQVVITVVDINDLKPVFTQDEYSAKISENTKVNTEIITVKANDGDAGRNGQVWYGLLNSQDRSYFKIDRNTGVITLISVINFADYPNGYKLRVRAQDRGRPPNSKYCTVIVSIVDVNDHAPVFSNSKYEAVVSEDKDINAKILEVKANDEDSGENARISYSFVAPTPRLPFSLNSATGLITLVRPLDFEDQNVYVFTVKASDHGQPPKYSTANVEVTVRDINDNAPVFTKSSYDKRISETAKIGHVVVTVEAHDLDKESTLDYSITEGNYRNKFRITTRDNTGVITLFQRLNFNERRSYVLTVRCSDGELSGYTKVRVNVTDANTHVPEFEKSIYDIYVDENVKIGTEVAQVHATDDDDGDNAMITYHFQDESDQFVIDENTGSIKTKAALDFDDQSQLQLTVIAKDRGVPPQEAQAEAIIYLGDVNDNAPKFDRLTYQASVPEDIRVGGSVVRIHADDADSGKNGQVMYTFDNGNDGNGYFTIDQNSGIIRTAMELDREHLASYDLTAYAEDRGTPTQRTAVRILVTVTDVDDNPPTFEKDVLVFNVSEDSRVGSVVAKLVATDLDEGGQSDVNYELSSIESMEFWDLDPHTGELRPTFQLDYEKQPSYVLIVSAYSGLLVSEARVIINLIDVNDNPPVLNPFQVVFNNYRTDKPYAFPIGPIGKVPAHDPDVTSVLTYRFTPGTNNSLLILNETSGELRLSSKLDNDREFEATFIVEVSDGEFNASAECHLKVVPITDEMLINSVTVRVERMSQEDFLSEAMQQFTHGLGQILNITTQDVYIFNVQNDTDVSPHAVVNVSFSAKHADGHYLSTQQLQEQVYLNRSVLTNYSMQNVMPFDDNICLREPCENYMRCVSALYFNSSAPFISTSTILFRPIHPVSGLRCKCPEGFAGVDCRNEVNMCHASKCKNGGKCVSVEGGYVCRCNNSYAGHHCEVDLTGGRCSSANGVCKNNAKCRQFPAGGLQCDCKMSGLVLDEVTKFCELRGRSFQKGDFIMFSGITRQWRFTLQLSFVTHEKNGLLLYNGRFNHEHDYLALEILDGQVQLNFSTGQEYTVVRPYIKGGVADGKWHTVEVQYRNKPKSEVFNGKHTGPSNIKVVTVTVDPDSCDPAILDKWDDKLGNYTCSKKATQGGTKSSLDLTTPLLVGGVPTLPERYQVRSNHFIGCIRDLYIDQQLVDMSSYVANHGSQPGCKAMRKCTDSPCAHGSCESVLGAYKCNCEGDYGGRRCEKIQTVHRFVGSGCLKLKSLSNLPIPASYPWQHTVSLRTTRADGTILEMTIGESGKIKMGLQNGKLEYFLKIGIRGKLISVSSVLNDGEWHEVAVNWRRFGVNVFVGISIDDELISDTQVTDRMQSLDSTSRLTSVHLGGSWNGRRVEDVFNGCLRGLQFKSGSAAEMPVAASNFMSTPSNARVTKGCRVRNPCDGNKCPRNSDCVPRFDTPTCQCHQGYVGNACISICKLNPCGNDGKCVLDLKAQYGYRCHCQSEMFYGRTCEYKYQYPCPSGWWAGDDHICSPCNCPFEKNFDPDCNSHGGKCICRKNYYYKSEKNACLPCDCYRAGSNGSTCEDETGQCKCKVTVIGKKCNQCSSNFAEVQFEGCNVQYGMCPKAYVDNVLWKRAAFGTTVPARCPTGSVGHAKRDCNKEKGWLMPNLSNCTSKPYFELRDDIKNLDEKKQYFDEHRVRMSMDAVTRLHIASNSAEQLHEGDVLLSYELIMKILSSQNSLSGFDLTASRRKDFNKYLVTSTSHALDSDNVGKWWSVQHNEKHKVNSANLMKSYEQYVNALTKSMRTIWAKSIQEKSNNVQLLVESLSNEEDVSLTIGEGLTGVRIKMFAPDTEERSRLPKNGTIGVMEYTTIGKFLPLSYHDSRLDMKHPVKGFINSVVVSVLSHNRINQTQQGFDLISLTFPLLQGNGSNPQCVFWNFTTSSHTPYGGWSQRGCKTEHANKTHVTCTCSHLTSFAVLSDEEVVSVLDDLPVKIALYGSVAVIVICILICIGCSLFLQDVTSNHSKIHCNFGVAVLLSELFFSCGIMLTASAYACMASAIFIHFFFMSTLAWVFVEGLHLYRMLTEQRDVNRGNMRIYYLIGWGIPGIVTALSVGLDAKGFGNANFCWIRTDHLLVWSFAGPLLFCAIVYLIIFVLSLAKYFASKLTEEKLADLRTKLKSSFLLLPFVCALWGLALFAVNENEAQYYYIFAILNVTLGILLLLLHCLFNKEVRSAIRSVKERRWQKAELTITKQHLLKSSFSATPDASNGPRRINIGTSVSSASTAHTPSRRNHQNSTTFHDAVLSDDSDSDDSDSSIGSLASSRSSDEEGRSRPMYLNVNNSNSWPFKNGHLPMRQPPNGGLVVHSTPKEIEKEEEQPPSFCNGTPSGRSDPFVTSLPTVSESNMEDEDEEEEHIEEPHYLAINSTRKDGKKLNKEECIELLPMQETDSLPRKGILKNGRKSKPPTPIRTDSLQQKPSPITTSVLDTEETALIKKADMIDKVEQVAVLQTSSGPSSHEQLL